jgi:hypothetical protein
MGKKSNPSSVWPGLGQMGRDPDDMSEPEANAYELYCLTTVINDWPLFYDGILEKAKSVRDEGEKAIIADRLKEWEDRHIPRLLEIRSQHFIEMEPGHVFGFPPEEGLVKREFLIRNLSRHKERVALMYELSPVLASLVAIDQVLDQALKLPDSSDSA